MRGKARTKYILKKHKSLLVAFKKNFGHFLVLLCIKLVQK